MDKKIPNQDEEEQDNTSSDSSGGGAHIFTPETLVAALENAINQDAQAGIFSPDVVEQLKQELNAMKQTLEKKHVKHK